MPAWLLLLLPKLPQILWHGIRRFSSIILIALIVFLPLIAINQYGDRHFKNGYQAGYSAALKEHPPQTFGSVGTVYTGKNSQKTLIDVGIYNLRLGAYWRK